VELPNITKNKFNQGVNEFQILQLKTHFKEFPRPYKFFELYKNRPNHIALILVKKTRYLNSQTCNYVIMWKHERDKACIFFRSLQRRSSRPHT